MLGLPTSTADVGPPAHLRITEREPGVYTVQWRVPKALPPRAAPIPELPETCRPTGRRSVEDRSTAWLLTQDWRCEASLAGQRVAMRYPFADLALTTVVRVELLSGDRFAHVLSPGDGAWQLPRGTVAPDPLGTARRAVVYGVRHAATSWAHLVLILSIGLLGGMRRVVRSVTSLTLGQLAGVLVAVTGLTLASAPAEIALALAGVVLAREALRPEGERRRLLAIPAVAGLGHGVAVGTLLTHELGAASGGLVVQGLAVLGMDAAHLVGSAAVAATWSLMSRSARATPLRTGLAYVGGTVGVASVIGLVLSAGVAEPVVADGAPVAPGPTASGSIAGPSGSRRLAPVTRDVPIQSYLTVEPFEVRHEAMLRLAGMTAQLDLGASGTIDVDRQPEILQQLSTMVLDDVVITVDGTIPAGSVRRADFMTVDPTGALPRTVSLPEAVDQAVVGVVVVYPTLGIPDQVSLSWSRVPAELGSIPATVIDPESVVASLLSAAEPTLRWQNTLSEDPMPRVDAVEVEPVEIPLPLLSLPLVVVGVVLAIVGFRRRQRETGLAAARVVLALACIVGPFAQTAVALPGSAGGAPSERQARRILAGLLPNVYRAMEFRDEAMIYDRLEVSVTGEALVDVYLEQRRSLEMEERGGAQARVEAVEVLEAGEVESRDQGFEVRAAWTVGGMVTHFGHRHFRQNRYDARIVIVPVAGAWKIQGIEILEQDRIR